MEKGKKNVKVQKIKLMPNKRVKTYFRGKRKLGIGNYRRKKVRTKREYINLKR